MMPRRFLLVATIGLAVGGLPALASSDRFIGGESGLTVDTRSGVVSAGAYGERRLYVPLDVAEVLPPFWGVWSNTLEGCDPARRFSEESIVTNNGVVVIREDGLVSKSGTLSIARAYVHAPPSITAQRIESGKPIRLHARKFQHAREMLLLLEQTGNSGSRHAIQMLVSDDGGTLRIGERLPKTRWIRCGL